MEFQFREGIFIFSVTRCFISYCFTGLSKSNLSGDMSNFPLEIVASSNA